jgi:hypothetical protein
VPVRNVDFVMVVTQVLPDLDHDLLCLLGVEALRIPIESSSDTPPFSEAFEPAVSARHDAVIRIMQIIDMAVRATDDRHLPLHLLGKFIQPFSICIRFCFSRKHPCDTCQRLSVDQDCC